MKKQMIIAIMLTAAICASAQSDKSPVNAYFTTTEMPDMLKWCPAPPDTIGAAFAFDVMQYMWGKQMRTRAVMHLQSTTRRQAKRRRV